MSEMMKTVQECLWELDMEELVGEYFRQKALREVFASVGCGEAGYISVRKGDLT